jgi:hypothetical protein
MGANAQTAVPAFVAGEVLTAAEMTQVNTGIPVFANSTARDAAFGGSGEKVLAEGQYAYLESTKQTLVYDGSNWISVGITPGIVLISSTTIGSAVSTVTISNAFSSSYDNYRIMVSGGVASANTEIRMQLGATTAAYYDCGALSTYNSVTLSQNANNNQASWSVGQISTDSLSGIIDLLSPNLAKNTHMTTTASRSQTTGAWISYGGYLANTTQYTAFTVFPATGTLTGGTIRVYGYANS